MFAPLPGFDRAFFNQERLNTVLHLIEEEKTEDQS